MRKKLLTRNKGHLGRGGLGGSGMLSYKGVW